MTESSKVIHKNKAHLYHLCSSFPDNTVAFADSGCTSYFLRSGELCTNKVQTTIGIRAGIPDGTSISASHTANMNIDHILLDFPPDALRVL